MAAAGIVLVAICNTNRGVPGGFVIRGVPWVVPIVLAFVVCWTFLLNRTRFGRYVYAVSYTHLMCIRDRLTGARWRSCSMRRLAA